MNFRLVKGCSYLIITRKAQIQRFTELHYQWRIYKKEEEKKNSGPSIGPIFIHLMQFLKNHRFFSARRSVLCHPCSQYRFVLHKIHGQRMARALFSFSVTLWTMASSYPGSFGTSRSVLPFRFGNK